MMRPIPEDTTSDIADQYMLRGASPHLYPMYPTADSIHQRNEFVYYFPDDQFKVVVGPVNRANGWVWRVESTPDSTDSSEPDFFPTFETAFQRAESYADESLSN